MTPVTVEKKQEKQVIGPFKVAENQQAYMKVGILGFPGSGKTYTSALIAKGISDRLKGRPVFFLDTEAGSDFLVPRFKAWGIPLYVSKSRAFVDLLAGIKAAEENQGILIIDSITHFWKDVTESYQKKLNRTRLQFQDWAVIKGTWSQFTDAYLNSRVHIIMCGRAGYNYDYFTDEVGQKQLEKVGTKMKVENDMGYEPSLLLEMLLEPRATEKKQVAGKLWDHSCVVLKDRTTTVEGMKFQNPSFKDLEPVFDYLNIGGKHLGVETKDSQAIFEKDNSANWYEEKRRREVMMEELQGLMTSAIPGRAAEDQKRKVDLLQAVFGTRSWKSLEELQSGTLQAGLEAIKDELRRQENINKEAK